MPERGASSSVSARQSRRGLGGLTVASEDVISGVGHMLNTHFGAPKVYAAIQEWLNKHGY